MRSESRRSYGLRPASAAQDGDSVVGDAFPIVEELGRPGVEKDVPCHVGRADRLGVHVRVERGTELIGVEDVEPPVTDIRGHRHRVDDALDTGTDPLLCRATARHSCPCGSVDEIEEMSAFGLIEPKSPSNPFQNVLGHAAHVAPLKARVVLAADAGQHRDLLPSQPGDATVPAVGGQSGLVRRELRPPRDEELADVRCVVHASTVRHRHRLEGGPGSTTLKRVSLELDACGYLG